MLESLPQAKLTDIVTHQLSRSATSIGANYEESQASQSKDDFYYKIGICLREARETNYWLRIIREMAWIDKDSILKLIKESAEVTNIFGKIYSRRKKVQIGR